MSTEETPLVGERSPTVDEDGENRCTPRALTVKQMLPIAFCMVLLGSLVSFLHHTSRVVEQNVVVDEPSDGPFATSSLYRDVCQYYPETSNPLLQQKAPRIVETTFHQASQPWSWKECVKETILEHTVELNTGRAPDAILSTDFSSSSKSGPPILGFGGAITEATAMNFQRLSESGQEKVLELLFSVDKGLGYTLGRVPIHSCDFSVQSYTFDGIEDDFTLDHFDHSVQHDVDNGMIPFLQRAQALTPDLRLWASPWSPPPWMKRPTWEDDKGAVHAQKMTYSATPSCLRGDLSDPKNVYAAAWAQYIEQWVQAYSDTHGIDMYAITVQNEPEFPAPWEACSYTAETMAAFVEHHLGPQFHNSTTRIFGFDHNKDHAVEWMRTMLQNDTSFVQGTAYHWYAGGMDRLLDGALGTANLHRLRALVDMDKDSNDDDLQSEQHTILGSEACHCPTTGYAGGDPDVAWTRAERYAHTILADLAAGSQGWIEWNLLLDGIGGPNHLGNLCDAPLLAVPHRALNASWDAAPLPPFEHHGPMGKRNVGDDRTREELNALGFPAEYLDHGIAVQPMFHYTGHISKFVRPGSYSVPGLVRRSWGKGDIFRPVGSAVTGGGENNLARSGIELNVWPCEGSTRQQFRWNMVTGEAVPPTISVLGHDWLGNPTESCIGRTNDKDFLGVRLVDCNAGEAGFFVLVPLESSSNQSGPLNRVQLINPKHHGDNHLCLSILELENGGGSYGPMGGAQVRLGTCAGGTTQWSIDLERGIAVTHYFQNNTSSGSEDDSARSAEGLCLTTGWPFLQMGSFITAKGEKRTVILNEGKDAANYALRDQDRILLTNSIPPRSIQTILLD